MRNKNSNIQGTSYYVVKVISHSTREMFLKKKRWNLRTELISFYFRHKYKSSWPLYHIILHSGYAGSLGPSLGSFEMCSTALRK